jgi:hypothetical protein
MQDKGTPVTRAPNSPSGWHAFRRFRTDPDPEFVRRHGNWKHGRYSKQAITDRQMVRRCVQVLNKDLGDTQSAEPTEQVEPE